MNKNKQSLLFTMTIVLLGCVSVLLPIFLPTVCYGASANDSYWKQLSLDAKTQIQNDNSKGESHFYLGVAYAYLGELELAIDAFGSFEAIDVNCNLRRQFIENYKHSEQYTDTSPEVLRDWSMLAFAYYSDYRYSQSIAMFNRLIEAEPSNIWHYVYLGYVYCLDEKLDDAIAVLQTAIGLDPKNEYPRALLAAAYYEKGWTAKAALELLKAPGVVKRLLELNR